MPMPEPSNQETKDQFIIRCMGDDVMRRDFPEADQRYAVCVSQWQDKKQQPSGDANSEHN